MTIMDFTAATHIYQCGECYSYVPYQGCHHNCSIDSNQDDDGFCDEPELLENFVDWYMHNFHRCVIHLDCGIILFPNQLYNLRLDCYEMVDFNAELIDVYECHICQYVLPYNGTPHPCNFDDEAFHEEPDYLDSFA